MRGEEYPSQDRPLCPDRASLFLYRDWLPGRRLDHRGIEVHREAALVCGSSWEGPDLVLVSDALKARTTAAGIDLVPRGWERPSDHTPVWVQLD